MSSEADAFSILLLDEAKRFLEKANTGSGDERTAYLHAALIVGFSSLESHLNGIAEELSTRSQESLFSRSILLEKELKVVKGRWELGRDRFYSIEERLSFLLAQYADKDPSTFPWWSELKGGIKTRNDLVHPRTAVELDPADIERYLGAIISALNDVYLAVFGKGHPAFNRGLQSKMVF